MKWKVTHLERFHNILQPFAAQRVLYVRSSTPSHSRQHTAHAHLSTSYAEDEDESPAVQAAAPLAAPKAGGKKQQKGKKGANKFEFGSDDDKEFDLAPVAAASDDEDDSFAAQPATKPKSKNKAQKAAPASAFDLLNEDGSERSEEEEEQSEQEDEQPESRKGSGAAAGFAALDDGEAAAESEDEGMPVVISYIHVLSV